jgi:Holliday junction resolvase-like predicted endonuclease
VSIHASDQGPNYRPDLNRIDVIAMKHEQLVALVMELQTQRQAFWAYVNTTSAQVEQLAKLLQEAIHFSGYTIAEFQRRCVERIQMHNSLSERAKALDLSIEPFSN